MVINILTLLCSIVTDLDKFFNGPTASASGGVIGRGAGIPSHKFQGDLQYRKKSVLHGLANFKGVLSVLARRMVENSIRRGTSERNGLGLRYLICSALPADSTFRAGTINGASRD